MLKIGYLFMKYCVSNYIFLIELMLIKVDILEELPLYKTTIIVN